MPAREAGRGHEAAVRNEIRTRAIESQLQERAQDQTARNGDEYRNGKHQIFTPTTNAKYVLPLKFPTWLKIGAKVNE